jgi:hypothetical protein
MEDRIFIVAFFELIVGNSGIEVMNVVEAYIAGKPL